MFYLEFFIYFRDFCDCTTITAVVPPFTGVSHCNTCWYLKLADSIKADSELKEVFSEVAVDLTESNYTLVIIISINIISSAYLCQFSNCYKQYNDFMHIN